MWEWRERNVEKKVNGLFSRKERRPATDFSKMGSRQFHIDHLAPGVADVVRRVALDRIPGSARNNGRREVVELPHLPGTERQKGK
jgi:hypothetical protein